MIAISRTYPCVNINIGFFPMVLSNCTPGMLVNEEFTIDSLIHIYNFPMGLLKLYSDLTCRTIVNDVLNT